MRNLLFAFANICEKLTFLMGGPEATTTAVIALCLTVHHMLRVKTETNIKFKVISFCNHWFYPRLGPAIIN